MRRHVALCLEEWEFSFMLRCVTDLLRSVHRVGERPREHWPSNFPYTTSRSMESSIRVMCSKNLRICICTVDDNLSLMLKITYLFVVKTYSVYEQVENISIAYDHEPDLEHYCKNWWNNLSLLERDTHIWYSLRTLAHAHSDILQNVLIALPNLGRPQPRTTVTVYHQTIS